MKGKKFLAVSLAAMMTASSVGFTALADGENGYIENNEENVSLFSANPIENVALEYVRVNSNSEETAKGFSCNFSNVPNLTLDWKFELKHDDELLSTTTVKSTTTHKNEQVNTAFICWTGNDGESGTWTTAMEKEVYTTEDKPNKLVMHVGDYTKEFNFTLDETGGEAFTTLANVQAPSDASVVNLKTAITSTNSERTIEGISLDFDNIRLSKSLEIKLYNGTTLLSTTTVKEASKYYNHKGSFSCLVGWGGDVASSKHWKTEINAADIRRLGKDTLPDKVVVKQADGEHEFELNSSNFTNAVADAYENFAIFRTPTLGTVEWVPNYKDDSQSVTVSMGNIGRVHNDMKVELMHDDTVLAVSTAKDTIQGLRTEALTAVVVCDGRFGEASGSWSSDLKVNNWARMEPNKVRITNNGVETVCDIITTQGNYDGLKVASKKMELVKTEAENNMTDSEYPGKSAQALILTIGNVGYVDASMTAELYHDNTLLSTTNAKDKRLGQNYNGLGVTVIVDGDAVVSGSWETTYVNRSAWSLDTAPNRVKITIDGEEQWLDIDEIASYNKFTQFSIFGRSINVFADKEEVKADEIVTVSVKINGQKLANALYDLSYEKDKFEFVSASTGTVPENGTIKEIFYKTENACYEDGAVIATYTFKAVAQTQEVTADFTIANTKASTYVESIDATNIAAGNNEKASVKIKLKNYELTTTLDGEPVSGTTAAVPYTNDGHTFTVTSVPAASVTYKVNGTEVDSVSVKDRGTYEIEYTVSPALGYAEVTGTFTLTIGNPDYVVEVNTNGTEDNTRDYVSGKKIVLVYTDTDDLAFTYDGSDNLMIDVTERGYKYLGTTEYRHVYAFVAPAIEGGALADYEAKINCLIPTPASLIKLTYSSDLNFNGGLEVQDISTAYGIYNVNADYFRTVNKYQKQILRADTNGDKVVNGDDTGKVVTDVKTALGFIKDTTNNN